MAKRFALGVWVFVTMIVPSQDALALQSKCLAGKNKCASKNLSKLLKCHQLAETPGRSVDPNFNGCIDKANATFDGGQEPEKGCIEKLEAKTPNDCVTFDDTFLIADVIAACIDDIVTTLDAPESTQSKCGAAKSKCVAKKARGLLKCHQLAQTPGKPEDPNTKGCIDKARLKFDGGPEPAKGCFEKLEAKSPNDCEILDDTATLEALVDGCVADIVARIETPPPTTTSTSSTSSTSTSSTSTTSPSSSTTTAPSNTSTTSTSPTTSTSTSQPQPSTTSTVAGPTTTSTSSATSTTTSTSTSTTTSPPNCGNGSVNTGETCDDGNNSDNDSCPADCRIAACTPLTATQRFVQVHFQPPLGALVAGITVLADYPEGLVDLPGNGTSFPSGTLSGFPPGASVSVNDLNHQGKGHAVRLTVAGQGGNALPPGQLGRFRYQDCQGAPPPIAGNFLCTVIAASDPFLNPVSGVRCFVVIE